MGQCLTSSRAKTSKKKKKKNCHPNWGWNDIFYYRQASTQTSFRCYHFSLFIIGIILQCLLCFHVTSTLPWSLNSSWASTSLHFVYYEYYRFERAFFTLHPFLFSSRLHWELAVQQQRQQGFMLCLVRLFVWIRQQSISVVCNREYYFWLITCARKFSYKLSSHLILYYFQQLKHFWSYFYLLHCKTLNLLDMYIIFALVYWFIIEYLPILFIRFIRLIRFIRKKFRILC